MLPQQATAQDITERPIGGGVSVRWNATLAQRWREEGRWRDTTLGRLTETLVERDPSRVTIIEQDREYSAVQLLDEARRLASAMVRRGLQPGDVISYQIPNWYEGSVINTAASIAGLVVNPLVPIYRDNEVEFMLRDVRSKMVFIPRHFRKFDYLEMYQRVNTKLDEPLQIVVLRESRDDALGYADLLAEGSADQTFPPVDPDSAFVMMHTSGTTGRPKCVVHSHNSFLTQGEFHVLEFRTSDSETVLVATPISHIAGIILANLSWVVGGAKVVMMDTWSPGDAVRLVEKHHITAFGGATPFIRGLLDAARAAGTHLPELRRAGCGGAAVPPELILDTNDWFPNVLTYRSYGCTEVPTATSGITRRDDIQYGAYTDGAIKHTDVRIVDAVTGNAIAADAEGEILLRGPNMMLGYLRAEDNVGAFDEEGYFLTGDLGRIVDGRYLLITGRKKDLIIRNGENLSPKEIEDALFAHPGIRDVAVVGMPSVKTGEAVCAFVVPEDGETIDLASISQFLGATGLARQKIPERIEIVGQLPLSPQGKVLKTVLRQLAGALA